jgi:uncharacterized protein
VQDRIDALRGRLAQLGSVVVAYSGGVDSALVAHQAGAVLGDRALAVTAISPSLGAGELEQCEATAREWGIRWQAVETDEMEREAYRANGVDRCWHCKSALMDRIAPIAEAMGAVVALGVNLDDLGDHRPGQQAAAGRGAVFPLVDAGFTKDDVRRSARHLGLPVADKPAAACLASRVPYGTPVTLGTLDRVGRAEAALHALGLGQLRVRHYGQLARLEVGVDRLVEVVSRREEVVEALRAAGYRYATVDLEGFRSGNLNEGVVASGAGGRAPDGPRG